ncbi:ankyrin repeat and LEM domain-containing protein 2 homolog isoform X2 [Coccinella septempunctata]|uniref:ankyrin repeat and LEM domain-containing protein 2 homolog isoform X2 n=1 Tax=Coccinella septempunctata TaxID=41139 RepID=UPI001D068EAF|nr:ankyrin repeat and LEM domain-containing protein 2 homolog isoform X2 [Coccinella septempunctata]
MINKNMEPTSRNEEEYIQKENVDIENPTYYGVYIPSDLQTTNPNSDPNVFNDKSMVLQVLKQHKKARFKAFSLFHEAADFSLNGVDNSNISIVDSSIDKKFPIESAQLIGEKQSPFKGPKPQDLIILRKAIEKGDYDRVYYIIWKNPRYLISNGDTPSILQEGSRYNALHIAAKAKSSKIAELLLSTVSNVEFVKLLYGDDNENNAKDRAKVFADLYLNTPDKALNETPLHFAVKFGAVDVVEVLVSYPQCDKTVKNKYGQTPAKIICDRVDTPNKKLREKIEHLLEETYYVPVLRAEDNSLPPKIGDPFSPVNPPVFDTHPSSPRLEIQAYAGPMNKEGAERFRKVWKTPPRSLKFNTPTKNLNSSIDSVASLKYKDPMKGLEILGKTLATQYDISWKEYWPFLDSFIDIASEEGLDLFENYLKERVLDVSTSMVSMNLENTTREKTSLNVSSITELCNAFQAIQLNSSSSSSSDSFQDELDSKISKNFSPFLGLERACQVFATRFSKNILNNGEKNLINILDAEIKQLEIVILSYMNDNRFSEIDFSNVHCRLSYLIAQKLNSELSIFEKIESLIEVCSQSFDCFSSDDESANFKDSAQVKNGTSIREQFLCLAHSILNHLNQNLEPYCDNVTEQDCVEIWGNLTSCPCVLYPRKSRRNSNLQRSNSRKYNSGFSSDTVRALFKTTEEVGEIRGTLIASLLPHQAQLQPP